MRVSGVIRFVLGLELKAEAARSSILAANY